MSSFGSPSPFFLAGKKAYEVERSLRFNDDDSPWLERTVSSSSNRRTFTISAWVKRSNITNGLIFGQTDTSGSYMFYLVFDSSDQLYILDYNYPSNNYHFVTNRKFRDPSAWYHIVLAVDTTQATNTNRSKLYVNGVQETSFSTANYPAQNLQTFVNHTTYPVRIGRYGWSHTSYFDGYMAEFNFIDGQAYDPSYFGKTDAVTGQWNPKKYVGSYGTNGFYLNFSDNSGTTATTLGKDSSGNGNNFTPNNFSVSSGSGNDSVEDTPTNNFCTLNPLDKMGTVTVSEGNLKVVINGNNASLITGSFGVSSGKWYYEAVADTAGAGFVGWIRPDVSSYTGYPYQQSGSLLYFSQNGGIYKDGVGGASYGVSYGNGDIIGCAINLDDNQVTWYKNNSSQGTVSIIAGTYNPNTTTGGSSATFTFNFGQRAFSYTPPTGYKALNSANLPDPTIKLPNKHFDTLLWSGNATTSDRSITGLNFQPDWAWTKTRNFAYHHALFDSVRGAANRIFSDQTYAENAASGGSLASFDSNGITWDYGTGNEWWNLSGKNYLSWNWNAGGSTVTNNSGSISSQVRANATAGFSIVSYTGTGSAATIGHGLGVAPNVLIIKNRGTGNRIWLVYHSANTSEPATEYLQLDSTAATADDNSAFNDTAPTSTVFSVGTSASSNNSSEGHIAYCFSEVAGYSKFGKYTGNGNASGTFVFTGFRPAWVLIKCSSSTFNWMIYDSKRGAFNLIDEYLMANSENAEAGSSSDNPIDFLSNGFKLRYTNTSTNQSGGTYIYLCFAESPFKNARAR